MEEMMKLNNTLKMETVNQAWIGLQRGDTGRWQWSLADQTFHRDEDTYRNWDSGEEKNNPDEFCADIATKDGLWYSSTCNTTLPFVCYGENNTKSNYYIINNETKTWRDAQTYCRENYIDLVSVRNQTENEKIRNMIQNFSNVWIGLFFDRWKWSDQSNSSFRYWSSNKPSGGLNCAAVNVSDQLYWSDVNCTENLPFICHENKLVLIKQNLTWKEALRYCRNNHYDLVSVLTQEMQLWVKEVAQNASTEHVWLGLRHTCTLGFWYWVTGETICYQDWAPGNGTGFEDCRNEERTGAVQCRGGQQWISLPQSNKLNFICSNYEDEFGSKRGIWKKWHMERQDITEGSVVLMKDHQSKRNQWPLGRISRVFPSEDGRVRKVEIKVMDKEEAKVFIRPITEVIMIIPSE
ncbi:C-type mannose receptor 2-like [Clarias gariepinus]|uniref:C-type mannose receptor 2-like n=1 Tax=Clarias gariepinus TaxID=13013 RepID=UPI00234C9165|nr:C-type mannose receptor 2-like [Clarias gariepinus]